MGPATSPLRDGSAANLIFASSYFANSFVAPEAIGAKRESAYALHGASEVLEAEGSLPQARQVQQEALTLRQGTGEKGTAAESRLALAKLSLEAGLVTEAESAARRAGQEFQAESETDMEAASYAVLGHSYLKQGRLEDAVKAVEEARGLSAKTEDPEVRLLVGVETARVRAAEGRGDEAVRHLRDVLQEAKRYKHLRYEFEARLLLGEVEMKSRHTQAGRAYLESLRSEAHSKGFNLIADEAGAALAGLQQ